MADNGAHAHEHHGDTYTTSELVEILGVGKRRVLQMLERGDLPGTKDGLGRWIVPAPPVHALLRERQGQDRRRGRKPDADSEPSSSPSDSEVGRELIDSLKDQVQHLRHELTAEREANRENRRIIAGLIDRIPELEAPRDAPGSPQKPAEKPQGTQAPQTQPKPQRRPWWLRILGG